MTYLTLDFFKRSRYFELLINEISLTDALIKSLILLTLTSSLIFFIPNTLKISDKYIYLCFTKMDF